MVIEIVFSFRNISDSFQKLVEIKEKYYEV